MIANLSCELPKAEPFFLLHADDAEVHAGDLDRLVERIDRAEQLVGDVPADDRRPAGCASTSTGLISRPRSTLKVEKSM